MAAPKASGWCRSARSRASRIARPAAVDRDGRRHVNATKGSRMQTSEHDAGRAPAAAPVAGENRCAPLWRSLEDRDRTAQERLALQRELALPLPEGYSRRNFLQFMGASMALAGLAGCGRQPLEKIVPYV